MPEFPASLKTWSRRALLATIAAAGAATTIRARSDADGPVARRVPPFKFLTLAEAQFVQAACHHLLPDCGHGSRQQVAIVARYIDRQLAGPWGCGKSLYRAGTWQSGTPPPATCWPLQPAHVFRVALLAICRDVATISPAGRWTFERLSLRRQAIFLRALAVGEHSLGGVPSAVFFEMLLGMTVEAVLTDATQHGRHDRIAWSVRGYPGAFSTAALRPPSNLV
ncbi:MAG: gluconate 2-dehydrogenase subunit 3 family protein [Pseudomonadota bacterium]|nr:gluconate 2-dehydrogenase subunit 3 family protein [Pseudomonadota bacterium]